MAATEIADAYIALYTKMPGVKKDIEGALDGADDAFEGAGAMGGKKFSGAAAAAIAAGAVVVATAVAAVTAKAVMAFGELEQNIGGSEAVFGQYADAVQKKGVEAYKNLGLSQSEYLATANKMGALFQGSGIEQARAVDLTTEAMQRAADMASVMGIEQSMAMESVAGAAKGNFTMMDNLGVAMNATNIEAYAAAQGMTDWSFATATAAEKAEMAMAMFMDSTTQYAGNFAREATETVTGSIGLLGAAWESLLAGLGDENADMSQLTANLVEAIKAVIENIAPVVGEIFASLPEVLSGLFGGLFEGVDLSAVMDLATSLSPVMLIFQAIQPLLPQIAQLFNDIVAAVVPMATEIGGALVPVLTSLIAAVVPIISAILPVFADLITMLAPIIAGLVTAFMPIVQQILPIFSQLIQAVVPIIGQLFTALSPIVEAILPIFSMLMQQLAPIISMLVAAFMPLLEPILQLVSPLLEMVGTILPPLIELFGVLLSTILPPLQMVIGALIPVIQGVVNAISSMLIPVIDGITTTLGGLITFLTGVFTGNWEQAWQGIQDIFGGIWDTIQGIAKGSINAIIDIINGVIGGINSLADGVSDATGGSISFTIPSIPRLAEGGIVRAQRGGILANIGEGRYDEAVVPLSPAVLKSLGGGEINQTVIFNEARMDPRVALREAGRELKAAGV